MYCKQGVSLGICKLSKAGWSVSPRHLPLCLSSAGITDTSHLAGFSCGYWRANSGHHACMASTTDSAISLGCSSEGLLFQQTALSKVPWLKNKQTKEHGAFGECSMGQVD